MASFDYTAELERALLKIMTTSQMMCRTFLHRLTDDMFSTAQRKFILAVAQNVFVGSKAVLTKMVFEYEVGMRVDKKDAPHFIAEWSMIEALDVTETSEVLIKKLEDAKTGRQILQLVENAAMLLEQGQIDEAVTHIKRGSVSLNNKSSDRQIVRLTDIEIRRQMILDKRLYPEKYLGIRTGMKKFDLRTGGLFKGELTLLAGITGVGKSTLVKEIERGIVTLNVGKNVLHIANEEYQEQVEHKFDSGFLNIPYLDFKLAKITDEDLAKWEAYMKNWKHGNIFLKEVPAFTDVTLVEQAFYELDNKGFKIDVIVIDHLPHVKPIQKAWDPNDELKKAASDCKEIAKSLHVSCVVPTQAATVVAEKQEKGKRAGQMDVYGSKGQIHVANTFMIITEQGKDDTQTDREDWERDVYWLCDVKKNRDGGKFSFRAKHYVRIGKVEEVDDKNTVVPKDAALDAAKEKFDKEAEALTKQKAEELEKQEEEAIIEVEPPLSEVEEIEGKAEEAPAQPVLPVPQVASPQVFMKVPLSAMARFRKM